ncbi:serine/threonine-protein kinase [Nocardioides ferulae]|uniref:serine/threonine-protein kinase n=1 Tax=Nocardioides ferulae TaxID=2340821 RepID=UPI000EAC2CB8|nr:serine/threonine-protein kinase [Nocardioides ferulae]
MGYPKVGDEYGGRYRIVHLIGHGGMGAVYEATDKVLNRAVALKVVLPSLTIDEDFHARFAREASVLARIRSRNIVGIHEYGQHDDTVFFVTDLYRDGDLRHWISEHGPLDKRAALVLVAQVCEALADAHAAGVIHRDVKPGNVLLWQRPEGLVPYLCDFGIALDGNEKDRGLTRTGTLVGSPAYMAPERHFGHPADERGDVYSAGCLLWSALAGDAPYSGTDFQMINAHINSPVPQLDTGEPLDDRIDAVLAAALHKDPEQRVPTAAALRTMLLDVVREIDTGTLPVAGPLTDTVIGSVAGEGSRPAGALDDEPPTRVPGQPPVEDHTAVRPAPLSPVPSAPPGPAPTTPPAAPAAARVEERLDPATTGPSTRRHGASRRRRGALIGGVAAAVMLVAGTTAALVAVGGDDDEPSATNPGTAEPTPTESPSATPPPAPRPPRVAARPAYRAVAFRVTAPQTPDEVTTRLEYDAGEGWQPTPARFQVKTAEGGRRVCVRTRAVAVADGAETAGRAVRACGRAEPRTLRLFRTPGTCVPEAGVAYPCQWYGVEVAGYASGAAPQVRIRPIGTEGWRCPDSGCQAVEVGDDGRGEIERYFRMYVDAGVWEVDVDGIRTSGRLYYR